MGIVIKQENSFSARAARTRFQLLLAVFVGATLGTLIGVFAILIVNPSAFSFVQTRSLALQYRLIELLPRPNQPQFVPTPLGAAFAITPPTETSTPTAPTPKPVRTRASTIAPTREGIIPIQATVLLRGIKPDYQRWNNCGPTTLGMNLSYFGRDDTQTEIAAFTKPNPDDRNVGPDELAAYSRSVGMQSMIRENGTLDQLKLLLSNGLPVIVETSLEKQPQGWMGHYRLLTGYDANQFVTMDSYDGPNVKIALADLDSAWRAFNRLYIVIYPEAQSARVRAILADTLDDRAMYAEAAERARSEIQANPKDAFAQFNLGTSLVGLRRYSEAAPAFDRARTLGLPWRMLWYQFGPYEAYLHVGRYSEVVSLADSLLRVTDDLEESHYYKGLALRSQGRPDDAQREFHAALRYNKNYADAQRALATQ